MFGHQDDPQSTTPPYLQDQTAPATPAAPSDNSWSTATPAAPTDNAAPSQGAPLLEDTATDGYVTPSTPSTPSADPVVSPTSDVPAAGSSNLLDLKQQALQQLSPLVGQLEQTAEEKFQTTMMMIQASDNQDLLKTAFEAAQQITDDKARAQALLDVINEINYFTQHSNQ